MTETWASVAAAREEVLEVQEEEEGRHRQGAAGVAEMEGEEEGEGRWVGACCFCARVGK